MDSPSPVPVRCLVEKNASKILLCSSSGMPLPLSLIRSSIRVFFEHNEVGYNYRLPSINAAMGISQLKYFNRILRKKKYYKKFTNKN